MEDNSNFFKLLLVDESESGALSALNPEEKELVLMFQYSDVIKLLEKEKKHFLKKKPHQHSLEKILLHLAH